MERLSVLKDTEEVPWCHTWIHSSHACASLLSLTGSENGSIHWAVGTLRSPTCRPSSYPSATFLPQHLLPYWTHDTNKNSSISWRFCTVFFWSYSFLHQIPLSNPPNFVSSFLKTHQAQGVLPILWMCGHPLEGDQPPMDHTLKENWLPLPEAISCQ